MLKKFEGLAYASTNDFIYGVSKKPVTCKNGLVIGGGKIIPELNFTLPPMNVSDNTMPEVIAQYKGIMEDALKRAVELCQDKLVVEVELLPPATYNPAWGIEICKVVRNKMWEYESKHGLKSALRITPVDIREDRRSPHMWRGEMWDKIMETFEGCAKEGADFLAIESIGGKDIHDDAVMFCEIDKSLFALAVLGVKDMHRLWSHISSIAASTDSIPAGDAACGFGNTAMVLAERGFVPKLFSAVVRVISAVRTLAAFEAGAVGPNKDCSYEGVFIKAITGSPISMEGKSSACAHLSPLGNIAGCVADLWSNESVQNIKLLGGMAPTVSLEQLVYDCRLMNKASEKGQEGALWMRDLMAESDSKFDPQAYILRPDVVMDIAGEIVKEGDYIDKAQRAALYTIGRFRSAIEKGELSVDEREEMWLDTMQGQLEAIPADHDRFIAEMVQANESEKFVAAKYDL
ncbi:MAG: methanol--corrinoid methyltransferase [Clostridia bacterium]|nr:methanol--corrinoid methyltransferase [Clostridia bacterium]